MIVDSARKGKAIPRRRSRTVSNERISLVVVDALQVSREMTGVGRQALMLGEQLRAQPLFLPLEVRCAADIADVLAAAFPRDTRFRTPIRGSRPRFLRIAYQQLVAPLRDAPTTLLVCLGDQAPLWGGARVLLVVNDVRRFAAAKTNGRLEAWFYRFVMPRAARRAHSLVTISETTRVDLERLVGRRADVIAHHPSPRVDEPSRGGSHLLTVGALRPYKGVETVLRALAELPAPTRPLVVFAGPGEGRLDAFQNEVERLGIGSHVRFVGWVPERALDKLRRTALGTVNPSTYEGYGLAVAESLGYGLPTVASDIPAHREVAGEAALYFPPDDASALADRLNRLCADDGLRLRLAAAGLLRARQLAHAEPSWRTLLLAAAGID
jgi:glycosyltransferase involved in cell wall biosynthesis